jgi:Domain of unknown function (DUF4136)
MRRICTVTLGVATLVVLGCADEPESACDDTIVTRADPMADFTGYKTFAVVPESEYPTELPSDLPSDTRTSLEAANDAGRRELLLLGLDEVDFATGTPDVVLFSLAASDTDTGVVYECVDGYIWYGWWGYVWDPCAWLEPVAVDYEVATVLVGLADPANEEVVFGGVVQGILECGDVSDRLDDGVKRIFSDYPADQAGG